MYKHGNGRLQSRAGNGRFERSTLINTFGLGSAPCPLCGAINPYELYAFSNNGGFLERVKNDPPQFCALCGVDMTETPAQAMNYLILVG